MSEFAMAVWRRTDPQVAGIVYYVLLIPRRYIIICDADSTFITLYKPAWRDPSFLQWVPSICASESVYRAVSVSRLV